MKFTYLLSAFLATLAATSPIATVSDPAENTELVTRADNAVESAELVARSPTVEETPQYAAIKAKHSNLKKDHYYYFYVTWPRGSIIQGDHETKAEVEELRNSLGFDHIGIIVGQVTETEKTVKKKSTLIKNFQARLFHLTKDKSGKSVFTMTEWKSDHKPLRFGGETNKRKHDAVKRKAQDWIEDHPTYNVQTNNCNTFVHNIATSL
ncbi:hypothetical protein F4813DRAFT_376352 [Daldinia decipiens]|uniref:uncharacterized protein n=1 Tax=Daldinia decipiens TaxID=326647 RepID=UPI0020C39368|nr:uncharacterized protein F4813DRAFT_376352 [Daldinia decipiens]KAI1652926.1 hypothetical protein F4813DRAFT_376352 [Daldinia decipiens]